MKFPFFWQRGEDTTFEFQKGVVLNEQAAEANVPPDPYEAVRVAERDKMMLGDQVLTKYLIEHPEFHPFIAALAPVNRTTKHISKTDAKVMWLEFQILFTLEEMCMPPDKYEAGALEFLQGLEIYVGPLISDGYEGWKGKIITEQKKTIATEFRKGK
jgi:hypothetical protein